MLRAINSRSVTTQKRAREIMGRNFFGIEKVVKYCGVQPRAWELSLLADVPRDEMKLMSVRKTCRLVAVLPDALPALRRRFRHASFEGLAKGEPGWCLIPIRRREKPPAKRNRRAKSAFA